MQNFTAEENSAEVERIRSEYQRRAREIAPDFYSWGRPANHFLHCQTCRAAIGALQREKMFPLEGLAAADIGCGSGSWLLEFSQWNAARLSGIDLDETRIGQARAKLPRADLHVGDAGHLPWAGESFDVVSQFTLFTSILDSHLKRNIAAEMLRILKPSGAILWYDFRVNNPGNPNVRGIPAAEIRSLFPDCVVKLTAVTLAPPIARRVVPLSWIAGLMLECVPVLRTHYLGIIRKRP